MLADWEDQIREAFLITAEGDFEDQRFHDVIWEMSLTAFDKPREVQVVIDGRMNLHISAGDPGFVWFEEEPIGLTMPIECWIHTHPFGQAYFSSTDWKTIRTWEPLMNQAIVLGNCQSMVWSKGYDYTVYYENVDIPEWISSQTTLDDFTEEE
jgi:hypothetical protein